MKVSFSEWAKNRELSEQAGNIDEELTGIRETLKNALAQNKVAYPWGRLGQRIADLAQMLPNKQMEVQQVKGAYDKMITPINQAQQQTSSLHEQDPKVREIGSQAIQQAYRFFESFVQSLYSLGSGALNGQPQQQSQPQQPAPQAQAQPQAPMAGGMGMGAGGM